MAADRAAGNPGIEQDLLADHPVEAREHRHLADPTVVDHRHQAAALADLLPERRRHRIDRSDQQDDVERRLARLAGGRVVADGEHDIVDSQFVEQGLDLSGCRMVGLDQDHGRRQLGQDRASIAGRAAEHQDHLLRLDPGRLDQARERQRLDQVAAARQQQVLVGVGDPAQHLGQELLARHLAHRAQQARIVDLTWPQLVLDHIQAGAGVVHRQGSLAVVTSGC